MTVIYKDMDVVMVNTGFDRWHLGVIERDFEPDDQWIRATAKDTLHTEAFRMPGFNPDEVRPATADDIANAPQFARDWLAQKQRRHQEHLLDLRDPRVHVTSGRGCASLQQAGIRRMSDVARFTDKELLALKGIGQATVSRWRKKAAQMEAQS